jgi:hypothetical protein
MDCFRVLTHFYTDKNFFCIDTYETLEWMETDIPKPTKQELQDLYESVKEKWSIADMRQERNMLLSDCDFRVVSDYPKREEWLVYRQQLRDLPNNWNGVYPTPPE